MTTKQALYVHILLDRSGSMEDCRDETISAFNEYLGKLRADSDSDIRITLMTFDSEGQDVVFDGAPAADAPTLTRETFVPRAMTPLFDAVGRAVAHTDNVTLRDSEKISFVVLTDGLENASVEHTLQSVRALLESRQKDKGWHVVFLGADEASWAQGATMGAQSARSLRFSKKKMRATFAALYRTQQAYTHNRMGEAGFTDEERREAGED